MLKKSLLQVPTYTAVATCTAALLILGTRTGINL